MPSPQHEGILELFRLVPRVLAAALDLPEDGWMAVSGDMGLATAQEIRADLVLNNGKLVLVVEVQLAVDHSRLAVWAMTVASAARRFGVEVTLVIVTPSEAVARWARKGFRIGPCLTLRPVVLGPEAFATDTSAHARVLHALLRSRHADAVPAVQSAIAVLHTLDEEEARSYLVTMVAVLRPAHRSLLEAWMNQTRGATWPFLDAWEARAVERGEKKGLEAGRKRGLQEGRQEGRQEGLQEGRQEGRQEGERAGVVKGAVMVLERLLVQRFGDIPAHVAAQIAAADAERIADWSAAALTAETLDDVFRA